MSAYPQEDNSQRPLLGHEMVVVVNHVGGKLVGLQVMPVCHSG
jgi:hypothetical protein